jgi:serine-type D-Ala-D-Ala carboxypeptidase (penicillin-binding protein 5/6)
MRRFRFLTLLFFAITAATAWSATSAEAALATPAEHAVLMDGNSGQVLWTKDAFTATPPASMSKLMTLELLFHEMKDGRVKLTDTFPVSENAWKTQGSKMFVELGSRITVDNLIRGIIIDSGNDACVVIAESLGGTEDGFVDMMNSRAKKLGLNNSHFVNPNGLPDPPGQLMSVADLGKLAFHLIHDYPDYYHFFSERSFVWHNIPQQNRDAVLDLLPGTDGLKTGHTDAAGYGIVVSTVQHDQRLILVLNGLRYPQLDKMDPAAQDWHGVKLRAEEAARVMGMAFHEFRNYQLFKQDDVVGSAVVWQGTSDTVPLKLSGPLAVTLQVESRPGMKVAVTYSGPVQAPVAKGQQVGLLTITAPDSPTLTAPVYAANAVPSAGLFGRIFLGIRALLSGRHATQ